MIDLVRYKGYYGVIDFCHEDDLYFAIAVGLGNSSISCHGDTLEDAKMEFEDSIEYYLEVCEAEGLAPCTTDPDVAREMELLLSKKSVCDIHVVESGKQLAFVH